MATKSSSRKRANAKQAMPRDDLHPCDELNRMIARLIGLEAAVAGAVEGSGDWGNGVMQLIDDLIEKMEKCARAFDAVRKLRLAKGDANSQKAA